MVHSRPLSIKMQHRVPPVNPYAPRRLSGYFDAFVQNTQSKHDPSMWVPTLNCLHGQRGYLEDLLSKTVTTLNVLRDKQTRNERALSTNPSPRSRKKKILQNKWRTNKTIQTCENEERVILDCLQVCVNNISTLEAILSPTELSSSMADYDYDPNRSYADLEDTSVDWRGWTDGAVFSSLQKGRERSPSVDEIPPDTCLEIDGFEDLAITDAKRPPPLPPRSRVPLVEAGPPVPPNTALTQFSNSSLSAAAAVFEPSITHTPHIDEEMPTELDKLSISGLLASKRMQMIQKERFSDAAIGHLYCHLSSHGRPGLAQVRSVQSWTAPSSVQSDDEDEEVRSDTRMKRTNSI